MRRPPLTWIAAVYINIFRGVPALVSALWVYFGVSLMLGINFTVFQAGVIALVLLYSAFISEIYRAALMAIPRGQREAGSALGMQPLRVFLQIVLPQATKIAIPNIGSMFIGMVKDTSTFTVDRRCRDHLASRRTLENRPTSSRSCCYTAAAAVYVVAAFVDRLRLPGDRAHVDGAAERRHRRRLRPAPPTPHRICHRTRGRRPSGELSNVLTPAMTRSRPTAGRTGPLEERPQ